MNTTKIASVVGAVALLAICGIAAPELATAQTATDLKCNGCVGKKDLGKNAVTSKAIKNKSVNAKKLAPKAKPGGTAAVHSDPGTQVTGSDIVVESVTLKAPAAGNVTVLADWFFTGNTVTPTTPHCSITTGTTIDITHETYTDVPSVGYAAVSTHRTFAVAAGNQTYNLVCASVAAATYIHQIAMTGIYNPASY